MGANTEYLYIGLYVFIFLTILFGIQFLSTKSEEYLGERKKRTPYVEKEETEDEDEKEETETGGMIDVFDDTTTCTPTCTTSVHEPHDLNEICRITKGRSKGEKICRYFIEEIYQKPFPSTYPSWLRSPVTKVCLELDGYNEELGIAFEYNGGQHYKRVPFWQTEEQFMIQLQNDKFKRKKCREKDIYLMTIPLTIPHDEIKDCIDFYLPENVSHRRKLKKLGYAVPEEYETKKLRANKLSDNDIRI